VSDHPTDGQPDESEPDRPEEPNPVRRTLDLLVFAPVGVALTVVEDLPGLVSKGRRSVEDHVRNARVVGQFVVGHGQRDVMRRVGRFLDGEPPEVAGSSPSPAEPAETRPTASAPKPLPDPADEAVVQRALAGYDTLSASQVVRRLESLGPEELHAVHQHEASHRNRRTILNRTNQLLGGEAPEANGRTGEPPEAHRPAG
jgi:hypothetical protein